MSKPLLLALPALLLVACSSGTSEPSGIWTFATGGSHDVSLCELRRAPPTPLRCVAQAAVQRVGLATCGDLVADNTLTIDRHGSMIALATAGAVTTSAPLHVAGSLIASGKVRAANTQDVEGNLETGGGWLTTAPVTVGGDAYVSSLLDVRNSATITGTLHAPQGSKMENVTCPSVVFGAVEVPAPLDCPSLPSVRSIASDASATLDPAATRALPPLALADVKLPTEVTLGCGTYVLSSIEAKSQLALHIVGNTVLVVQGDVHVASPMTIDVAEGATLDLVIVGRLDVDNTLRIGSDTAPSAVWLGVGAAIHVAAPMVVSGVIYAPTAPATIDNTLDVHGAALMGPTHIAAPVTIEAGPAIDPRGCIVSE